MAERKTSSKGAADKGDDTGPADGAKGGSGFTAESASAEAVTAKAAPLDAPQRKAVLGNPDSSTNYVAANAALRSPPGATHNRLLTEDGQELGAEDIFEFPPPESPSMLATVRQRVIQEFTYPGASTPTRHLMYPAGAQVPVGQAIQVRDAMRVIQE